MLNALKTSFVIAILISLFACTNHQKQHSPSSKKGYLKTEITQKELNNPRAYKRYSYVCKNAETGRRSYLNTYFPLSRESRMKDNFGIYFQLEGGKAVPFDHIENRSLNARGSRFEVIYRSYEPINGNFVDLIARQHSSTYYKNYQGMQVPWLNCRGG